MVRSRAVSASARLLISCLLSASTTFQNSLARPRVATVQSTSRRVPGRRRSYSPAFMCSSQASSPAFSCRAGRCRRLTSRRTTAGPPLFMAVMVRQFFPGVSSFPRSWQKAIQTARLSPATAFHDPDGMPEDGTAVPARRSRGDAGDGFQLREPRPPEVEPLQDFQKTTGAGQGQGFEQFPADPLRRDGRKGAFRDLRRQTEAIGGAAASPGDGRRSGPAGTVAGDPCGTHRARPGAAVRVPDPPVPWHGHADARRHPGPGH